MSLYLSLATCLVTGLFAGMVLERFWKRKSLSLLGWGIGLLLYSIGTMAQAVLTVGFEPTMFKLWYWTGAMLVPLWLGQGTVFLLVRRGNLAWVNFWLSVALSILAAQIIFTSPLDSAAYQMGVDLTEQYQSLFAMTPAQTTLRTLLVIFMNSYGTLLLVGGAIYSLVIFARKHVLLNRVWGNVLIALGGLLPALGGALILIGDGSLKYLAQLLGAIALFAGFLIASRPAPAQAHQAPA